jgi:hypothetical protein
MTSPEQPQGDLPQRIGALDYELNQGPAPRSRPIVGAVHELAPDIAGEYKIIVYSKRCLDTQVEPGPENIAFLADGTSKRLPRSVCSMAILTNPMNSDGRHAALYYVSDSVFRQRELYRSNKYDEVDPREAERVISWASTVVAR